MVCKHCGSENIVKGVVFGDNDIFQPVGPRYREGLLISFGAQTYCDLCDDCGEIQRIYVIPKKGRKWITDKTNHEEVLAKRKEEEKNEEEAKHIENKIEAYRERLMDKQYDKKYVDDLNNYDKHKWYDYPVKTKGPSYRLYIDKTTEQTVLVRPATMNLHKGKYVVCYEKPDTSSTHY